MTKVYDFIIIGGGPSGLSFAQLVSKFNKKILIIERENEIGGCHRVKRINGRFTEHGPRVYGGNYIMFQKLLEDMNLDFNKLFTKYKFGVTQLGDNNIFQIFTMRELFILTLEFIYLIFNDKHGENTSVKTFVESNNFSNIAKDNIDRICRLTDGAEYSRYTLNEFLQLFNQNIFYNFYQPIEPNDIGLFKKWRDYLENKNVEILTNTDVQSITVDSDSDILQVNSINTKNIVFAVPPKSLKNILDNTIDPIKNVFGDYSTLVNYINNVSYIDYISVTLHWNSKLKLPNKHGFPRSEWGIAYITMSDYFDRDIGKSETLISTIITITDSPSKRLGLSANMINKENVLIDEIIYQLKSVYNLPNPDFAIISPNNKYDYIKKKWISLDSAYMKTTYKQKYLNSNGNIKGIYNLGSHNGNSRYAFTSMESSVSNSITLATQLFPSLINTFYIRQGYNVKNTIFIIIFLIIVLYLLDN